MKGIMIGKWFVTKCTCASFIILNLIYFVN
jgi:hypothetical protein